MTPQDKFHVNNFRAAAARLEQAEEALEEDPDGAGPAAWLAAAIIAGVQFDIAESDAALAVLGLVNHVAGVPPDAAFQARRAILIEVQGERPWRLQRSWLRVLEDGSGHDHLSWPHFRAS